MNRILPLFFVLIGITSHSQISLTRHNGTAIANGQVVAFNTIAFPASEMDFYVRNLSTATTNVKVSCESLVNNDGTGFELCFGNECLSYVEQGEVYPSTPVVLAPNGVNGDFDHFLNTNAGSGTFPKDYVFRFYQINGSGSEFGNSITMTYRYDPSLSVDDINQLETSGVIVKSTLVENELTLDVLTPSQMTLFDTTGKLINSLKLAYGVQTVDVSNLSQGVYILKFTTAEGGVSTKKILKN